MCLVPFFNSWWHRTDPPAGVAADRAVRAPAVVEGQNSSDTAGQHTRLETDNQERNLVWDGSRRNLESVPQTGISKN